MDLKSMSTNEILSHNPLWKYDRTDRNGTRYFLDSVCPRCGGKGIIPCYGYIDNGTCFECGGSGIAYTPATIKVYTPEYEQKLVDARQHREELKRLAREAEFRSQLPNKMAGMGFGFEDDEAVCYKIMGNTYAIKDKLKELGCKYQPAIGWYSSSPLQGYDNQRLKFNDLCDVNLATLRVDWRPYDEITKVIDEARPQINKPVSIWQGTIGDKIDINVTITSKFSYEGRFGTSFMYLMHDNNGNIYKWSTTKCLEVGRDYTLQATVKDHATYQDTQQTVITRAKVQIV